jgi:hypothetical protein
MGTHFKTPLLANAGIRLPLHLENNMFLIERENNVSFLRIQWHGSVETIAYCRTEWLPVSGEPDTLAHCHDWNFMERPLLSAKGEAIVQWLEATRRERIELRRDRGTVLRSCVSKNRSALMNSRKDATVPYM